MNDDTASVRGPRRGRRALIVVVSALVVIGLAFAVTAYTPVLDGDLSSHPAAATSHEQGAALAAQLLSDDGPEVNPECRSIVIDSGERAARSVVLLHGFTSCPAQFRAMAQAYARAGYNVVVPRLPGHGLSDRLTGAPSEVTPQSLADATDRAIDIAAGLGGRVTVVGLSGGGALAAWAGAHRDDVTEADVIAPLMLPKAIPGLAVAPIARVARYAPDYYLWWDGEKRETLASPPYAYPRYSLRSLGAFLALGRDAQLHVTRTVPLERLLVVTNANDGAVSNDPLDSYERAMAPVTEQLDTYEFPADLGYKHDVVTVDGENAASIDQLYATLGDLLGLPGLRPAA